MKEKDLRNENMKTVFLYCVLRQTLNVTSNVNLLKLYYGVEFRNTRKISETSKNFRNASVKE